MKEFLHHLFIPRESNNHRAKFLHHKSLFIVIAFLFVGQFFIAFARTHAPSVLGIQANITLEQLLSITNEKRKELGLLPLKVNDNLSKAATLKANDMFAKDYWAHNSPDGLTPWVYFRKVDYDYMYAGENLARGFTDSNGVVAAWLASPTHRDNMLSKNYDEVGFAVAQGKLLGEETTLVVEMFGNRTAAQVAQKPSEVSESAASEKSTLGSAKGSAQFSSVQMFPFIGSQRFSATLGITVAMIFIFVLSLDMIIVMRKRIVRFVGHNIDHIFLFAATILMLIIVGRGAIL